MSLFGGLGLGSIGGLVMPTLLGTIGGQALFGKRGAMLGGLGGLGYGLYDQGFLNNLLTPAAATTDPTFPTILSTAGGKGTPFSALDKLIGGFKQYMPDVTPSSVGNTLLMGSLLGGGGNQRVPFQGGSPNIIPSQYNASGRISPDFSSKVISVKSPSMGLIQPYSTTGFGGSRMFVDDYLY